MDWIEYLGSGFIILGLFTIVFIVIGFLSHETGEDSYEQPAPSALKLYLMGASIAAIGFGWGYWAWTEFHEGESTWYWVAFLSILAIEHLFRGFQYAREAKQLA